MDTETAQLKSRVPELLAAYGVEIRNGKIRCPHPTHPDIHPSGTVYDNKVRCESQCGCSYDIFDIAGFYDGLTDFKSKKTAVMNKLAGTSPVKASRTKTRRKVVAPVPFKREKLPELFSEKRLLAFAGWSLDKTDDKSWDAERVETVYPFYDSAGDIEIVEVRFIDKKGKKQPKSFCFNGKTIVCKGCPVKLFNLPALQGNNLPVLIHEGPKCAIEAAGALRCFASIAWNGGGKKYDLPDWSPLKERSAYIFPDDDKAGVRTANKLAALLANEYGIDVKIVPPLREARKIKPKGADVVEALQALSPEALTEYILNDSVSSSPEDKPRKAESAPPKHAPTKPRPAEYPFEIIGTGDDNRTYFIRRDKRLAAYNLDSLTPGKLLALAPREFWSNGAEAISRNQWTEIMDNLIEVCTKKHCDVNDAKGRGAWKTEAGELCYWDGEKLYGDIRESQLFLRLTKRDIGLDAQETPFSSRQALREAALELSFATRADGVRTLGWAVLAPFAGALPWRTALLITGKSKTGKSTILELLLGPLTNALLCSMSDSSAAGIRQAIHYDAIPVIVEEAEQNSQKQRQLRTDIFALMRQSTTENAPAALKGTKDGAGMRFKMNSMFCFVAISPEVDAIADANRMHFIDLTVEKHKTHKQWLALTTRLKKLADKKNCRGIRAFTWRNLDNIFKLAERVSAIIQERHNTDMRYAVSEGLLIAAYLIVWKGRRLDMSEDDIAEIVAEIQTDKERDPERDEAVELITRLLDKKVLTGDKKLEMTIGEMLHCLRKGEIPTMTSWGEESAILTSNNEKSANLVMDIKNTLKRHGVYLQGGELMIVNDSVEMQKILGRGTGYIRLIQRHPKVTNTRASINWFGKTRNCTIIQGVFDGIEDEDNLENDNAAFA